MPVLMQLPGFTGESDITGHVGWMKLTQFGWGGSRPFRGQGAGAARVTRVQGVQVRNVTVARECDSQTPLIWLAMINGTSLSPVKFSWLRTGSGQPEVYFAVTLLRARICSIGEAAAGSRPIERLEFLYEEIEFNVSDVGDSLAGVQDVVTYKIGSHVGS